MCRYEFCMCCSPSIPPYAIQGPWLSCIKINEIERGSRINRRSGEVKIRRALERSETRLFTFFPHPSALLVLRIGLNCRTLSDISNICSFKTPTIFAHIPSINACATRACVLIFNVPSRKHHRTFFYVLFLVIKTLLTKECSSFHCFFFVDKNEAEIK